MNAAKLSAAIDENAAREAKLRAELEACFSRMAATPDGEQCITHLCHQFQLGERLTIADKSGAVDPHRAAIREGEQAAVFHILKLIARGKGESAITIPIKTTP